MTTFSTVVYFDMLHSMLKRHRTGAHAQTSSGDRNAELAWANDRMPFSQKKPSSNKRRPVWTLVSITKPQETSLNLGVSCSTPGHWEVVFF